MLEVSSHQRHRSRSIFTLQDKLNELIQLGETGVAPNLDGLGGEDIANHKV
ncbi:MAG: hypothetical protein BWY79_00314 [Actinobacteria bacterium ADurb.Bin444]|nr:MAG: hypothetical protein BWY79_00314 [Actinobacteria bacterium ADurb.Bin444]